ncbi:family 20 glycosylhydrolase [Streptomyces sp. NBC_01238]|uniref:family 20 glycosylhydrolase n=2 Tax=Streptomyces TaxID=1883 RepID=UPI00386547CE
MLPPQVVDMFLAAFQEAVEDTDRMGEQRARVVISTRVRAYLDRPYADAVAGEAEERRRRLGRPGYPPLTIRESCTAPITGIDDGPGFDVAGFETTIWCETVNDSDDLSFLLLPRLPGLAERAWTAGPARNWEDLRARLAARASAWRRHGHTWFPEPSIDWVQGPGR